MEDYRYNQYDEYTYGDESSSEYTYEMGDPDGGGGGNNTGPPGETAPGGYYSPPTVGVQDMPTGGTSGNTNSGGGTTDTETVVHDDGTAPGDNEGYEGEIRTVMTAEGPIMYIKQNGVWVVYYGTSNFAPDGSNIQDVIAAALSNLGFTVTDGGTDGSGGTTGPGVDALSGDVTLDSLTVTGATTIQGLFTASGSEAGIDHGSTDGRDHDDHEQYALLAGRGTGQTLKGGLASGNHLYLESTNHGTKGDVRINANGGNAIIGADTAALGGLHIQRQGAADGSTPNVSLHMAFSSDTDMYGQIHTTSAGKMILRAHSDQAAPGIEFQTYQSSSSAAGDVVFGNTAGDVRPNDDTPTVNLGTSTKKWKDIWAETLRVQTLVNEEVIATIGGRIIVSPSTSLADDLANNDTSARFRHSMTNGTYAVLKKADTTEYIKIIGAVGSGTGADGATYYTHPITKPDGSARNGSGTYAWDAGDCVAGWCGSAVDDGMMELYSGASIRDAGGSGTGSAPEGPSILGRVRTSTSNYHDTIEAWCVGNLDNTFGNTSKVYGLAAGKYANNGSWIQVDGTTGIRIKAKDGSGNVITKFSVNATGDTQIGDSASSSESYVFIAGSDGHDMIGTNLVNTGDVLLYGGSADKYIHLDTSASTVSIKGSGTSSIVLDGSGSGTITTTGIIQGSAFQTGTANQRVIVSDNDITNTGDGGSADGAASNLAANTMASFVEILPHGSSTDNTGGNNDDYIMLGITKDIDDGSKLKLGGHHTTNGKVNGYHQTIAKQNVASASIGNSVLSQWWAMDNDASGRKYETSHAFQIKANSLSQYIYRTSDTTWHNSNLMETTTPVGTSDSQFEAAMNSSKLRAGGFLQVGANISGGAGCVAVCPAPYDNNTLHTSFMDAVGSGFGTKWGTTDVQTDMKHNRLQYVNHIVSNRALAISSRGTKLAGTTASISGYNFFGHASGVQSDSLGRISIRRINANTTGWAVGVISKQTEDSLAILMWVYISDGTVNWAFLDQAGNTSTTDGEGFSSQTNTITIVDDENEDNRININLSQNEVRTYFWHQLCGSVAMGAAEYAA